MIRYSGVNHLAMATSDMDRTIRYWRDLLGMRLVVGIGKPGYRHYFFEIAGCCRIAFFEWYEVRPVQEKEHGRPVSGPFVFDHIAISVETRDDLWNLKDRIDAAGFWVSEVVDHGFIHSIYSFDPNGIPVEFSWNVEGVDVSENPLMADTEPTACAQEGPEPLWDQWPAVTTPTPESERKVYPGDGSKYFDRWRT